jgi:hypothetical protein
MLGIDPSWRGRYGSTSRKELIGGLKGLLLRWCLVESRIVLLEESTCSPSMSGAAALRLALVCRLSDGLLAVV